jgi:hypothetical protein
MIDALTDALEWFGDHPAVMWWSGAVSATMFFGTLLVVPVLLVKMPADYFLHDRHETPPDWRGQHPALRWSVLIGKNLLGGLLVGMGILMLVLPGQGLLTILLGITLLDLPGKRRLEIALMRRPGVSRAVNWLRRKYGRPPLQMPAKSTSKDGPSDSHAPPS